MAEPLFSLGQLVATRGALEALQEAGQSRPLSLSAGMSRATGATAAPRMLRPTTRHSRTKPGFSVFITRRKELRYG